MIKASVAHDGSKIFTVLHLMTDWSFLKPYAQTYPELEIREKEIHKLEQQRLSSRETNYVFNELEAGGRCVRVLCHGV